MANMFWNLDKISETTAIHSGFRLCPIISHSSIRRTIPVAFISKTPFVLEITVPCLAKASIRRICLPMQRRSWIHLETGRGKKMFESCKIPPIFENTYKKTLFEREKTV